MSVRSVGTIGAPVMLDAASVMPGVPEAVAAAEAINHMTQRVARARRS